MHLISKVALATAAVLTMVGGALATGSQGTGPPGQDLTVVGAERAGNKDGTIPTWEDKKDEPLPGWSYGKYRGDFWKYKDERALFSIDASNVDKYADKLSPGQVQFIKQTKDYRMDIYPTRRNAAYPDWINENTKKNAAGAAKLSADLTTLEDAALPGIPFPNPKNGAEAIWNNLLRYEGIGIEWPRTLTAVSPRSGSSDWLEPAGPQVCYWPWAKKGTTRPSEVGREYMYLYFSYDTPAALAGQGVFQIYPFGKVPETFFYFPGQRRVRRLPTYAYDAPQIGFENQYPIDTVWVIMPPIDRFDWKLLGKKEMYIPYNTFGMYDFNARLHDTLWPKFLNPAVRRYELHRVWVVEATLKKGMRHTAPRRTFYLDEDTWLALVGEDYDASGALWKLREGFPIPVWELEGVMDHKAYVHYDLANGRYIQDQGTIGTGKDIHWFQEINDPRFRADFYTSENLRAISER